MAETGGNSNVTTDGNDLPDLEAKKDLSSTQSTIQINYDPIQTKKEFFEWLDKFPEYIPNALSYLKTLENPTPENLKQLRNIIIFQSNSMNMKLLESDRVARTNQRSFIP